jgi:hypothetical protein
VTAAEDMVIHRADVDKPGLAEKAFHLDPYWFDSTPERVLFWDLLRDGRVLGHVATLALPPTASLHFACQQRSCLTDGMRA